MLLHEYTDLDVYYWDRLGAVSSMAIWEDMSNAVRGYNFNYNDSFVDILINKNNIETEEFIEYRIFLISVLEFSMKYWAKEQFKSYIQELEEL
jgi:Ca2+-binding EF-hand superfamily protein